jgi:hypothetical protein
VTFEGIFKGQIVVGDQITTQMLVFPPKSVTR